MKGRERKGGGMGKVYSLEQDSPALGSEAGSTRLIMNGAGKLRRETLEPLLLRLLNY